MPTTWVLVADRARARLFSLDGHGKTFDEIENYANPDGRAEGKETQTERPPRVHDSMSAHRHAIEPRTSEKEKAAERFARELHDVLERGRVENRYGKLMLVAAPAFLGLLHGELNKHLRERVVFELNKDLTMADASEIRTHLPQRVPGELR